jgi:hypothetical protein
MIQPFSHIAFGLAAPTRAPLHPRGWSDHHSRTARGGPPEAPVFGWELLDLGRTEPLSSGFGSPCPTQQLRDDPASGSYRVEAG